MHTMRVNAESFRKMQNGEKTVEVRLNDDKRRMVSIGDIVTFINRDNEDKHIHVRTKGFSWYTTFDELYEKTDKAKLGYKENETANPEDVSKYYTAADEYIYGVTGIHFELVPDYKTLDEMTEDEVKEWLKNLEKRSKKVYNKLADGAYDIIGKAKAYASYVENYPELFADDHHECNLDYFKWTLKESIRQTQALLDRIQETEEKLGLPVINKY